MAEVHKSVGMKCVMFEGQYTLIKRQVAEFYEVTERTIDNLIEKYNSELTKNGYNVIRGKQLTDFKLVFAECFDSEMDFVVKWDLFQASLSEQS